ncbi:MAG: hypothetical protein JO263_06860, partial [Candidatus Eremiobacteraeota bacterium]|nr:hypothetical protein [Candidatus Eremiobacteraeota bacterium]
MAARLISAILAIAGVAGCSQSGMTLPTGSAQAASQFVRLARPAPPLRYFSTPTQGAWPDYI